MIINIPAGEIGYYTAPPLSEIPIKVQIKGPGGQWRDYGSIKYTGHVVTLYGAAEYRTSIAEQPNGCCLQYREVDVIDATPVYKVV